MITLDVNLPDSCYPIYIGRGLLDNIALLIPKLPLPKVVIISNSTIAPLYLARLQNALSAARINHLPVILPDGEEYKNWQTLNQIFDTLIEHRCERQTTVLALGGGVIGDIAGFAAACYQRGMPFIQLPTTLLAQVDAAIGGKTAINHPLGKNMIGAFYQPCAVIIDIDLLDPLPEREYRAGLAEVIKYGLLGDLLFLEWLEQNMAALRVREDMALQYAIKRSCEMKVSLVYRDAKEQNLRALLNLGHTFAHAIETGHGYGTYLHGEAVAMGMVIAVRLSNALGWITKTDVIRVENLLEAAGLPTTIPALPIDQWLALIGHDKKVKAGIVHFVLLKALGCAVVYPNVPTSILEALLAV